jgi:enoyl-[acyl-carrier protein] reductase II
MLLDSLFKKGSDFLGVRYPIISGGMTWISDFHLAEAVGNNRMFPVIAAGNMPPDMFEQEVDRCVSGLRNPFAVNLITIAPNYKVHYEILKTKKVPFVVFAGSFPHRSDIQRMKASGKKTMSFASEESIAKQQINCGIDALILEGSEAGGHIGHVSLTILLQQVLFHFDEVPIFVAGGIATGKMIAHLMMMGAAGCQLGTRFVMSEECMVHPEFKEAFKRARARQAVATPQYDSKLPVVAVRALKNKGYDEFGHLQLQLLRQLEKGDITRENAQFEVEKFWVGALRNAVIEGDVEHGSLMAGQSVGLMKDILPMSQIIRQLADDAEEELQRVRSRLCGV